jgi:hypothetical protein
MGSGLVLGTKVEFLFSSKIDSKNDYLRLDCSSIKNGYKDVELNFQLARFLQRSCGAGGMQRV